MERNAAVNKVEPQKKKKRATKAEKERIEKAIAEGMKDLNTGVRGAMNGTTDRSVWARLSGWFLGLFKREPTREPIKIFKYEMGDTLKEEGNWDSGSKGRVL